MSTVKVFNMRLIENLLDNTDENIVKYVRSLEELIEMQQETLHAQQKTLHDVVQKNQELMEELCQNQKQDQEQIKRNLTTVDFRINVEEIIGSR